MSSPQKPRSAHSSAQLLALVERGCEEVLCNFCPLKGSELSALARRLAESRGAGGTRSLDLCYCQLGALGLFAFSSQFANPNDAPQLSQLSLGANRLGTKGAQLAAELTLKMKLQRLDLEINELYDEGCRIFSNKALQSSKCTLQYLDLRMNFIQPDGAVALAKALINNRTLTHLDLGYNQIGTFGAETLCTALKNSNLQVLRLEDNAVKDQGAISLVALQLQELDLSFNQVTSEGAILLAALLSPRGVAGPVRFALGGNDLRDPGAAAFAAALQKNCCLEELALPNCGIGIAGGAALASSLQGNWRLRDLDLRDNEISDEAARIISETTSCAAFAAGAAAPERMDELLANLSKGTCRRFCSAWSVRAYLSWLTKDMASDELPRRHLVAAALASAIVDAEGVWYELPRLRELASLYGRKLRSGSRARAQGLYVLNLTPFHVTVCGSGPEQTDARGLEENTGGSLGEDGMGPESLQLSQKTARGLQNLETFKVDDSVGEVRYPLNSGELRVLNSRCSTSSGTAHFMLLLWSWPQRLRAARFHDLNFYWRSAHAGYVGPGTADAIEQVIKPDTSLPQTSLAELHMPGPAHTFVSHSWQLNVNQVVSSLVRSFSGFEMLRLWLALFSLNHWSAPSMSETPEQSCSVQVLKSRCQSFALVLGPELESLKRLWCLYELLVATESGSPQRPMSLKLCSPQGLLSVGTGGMPVSYILKVSSSISSLDVRTADGLELRRSLQEEFRRRGIDSCHETLRKFLMEGLSAIHRRGQEIFLQASKVDRGKTGTKSDVFDTDRSDTAAEDSEDALQEDSRSRKSPQPSSEAPPTKEIEDARGGTNDTTVEIPRTGLGPARPASSAEAASALVAEVARTVTSGGAVREASKGSEAGSEAGSEGGEVTDATESREGGPVAERQLGVAETTGEQVVTAEERSGSAVETSRHSDPAVDPEAERQDGLARSNSMLSAPLQETERSATVESSRDSEKLEKEPAEDLEPAEDARWVAEDSVSVMERENSGPERSESSGAPDEVVTSGPAVEIVEAVQAGRSAATVESGRPPDGEMLASDVASVEDSVSLAGMEREDSLTERSASLLPSEPLQELDTAQRTGTVESFREDSLTERSASLLPSEPLQELDTAQRTGTVESFREDSLTERSTSLLPSEPLQELDTEQRIGTVESFRAGDMWGEASDVTSFAEVGREDSEPSESLPQRESLMERNSTEESARDENQFAPDADAHVESERASVVEDAISVTELVGPETEPPQNIAEATDPNSEDWEDELNMAPTISVQRVPSFMSDSGFGRSISWAQDRDAHKTLSETQGEEEDQLQDLHTRLRDPVVLANRLAFAIMSNDSLELAEPSRGISEGAVTRTSSLHSRDFARLISVASSGVDIAEPGQFKRGFTEDELAVQLHSIFNVMDMERLPLFQLLCDLGHNQQEAAAMEAHLLPLLPSSQDGLVSCEELLQFLAQTG